MRSRDPFIFFTSKLLHVAQDFIAKNLGPLTAREIGRSLMKILAPLKPVLFQPLAYNLTDRGAVAIVEMNILLSGKHLFQ